MKESIPKEHKLLLDSLEQSNLLPHQRYQEKKKVFQQTVKSKGLAKSLIEIFRLSEDDIANAICSSLNLGRMSIASEIETAPKNLFTEEEMVRLRIIPIFRIGFELTVAFVDPPTRELRVYLQQLTGVKVFPVITTVSDFEAALKKYQGVLDSIQRIQSQVELERYDKQFIKPSDRGLRVVPGSETSMAQMAEEILLRAAKSGASDIHIEPIEKEVLVRFRIDGVLHRIVEFPIEFHAGLISVLKGRAGMDIFERGVPQDGRFSLAVADRDFDIRMNSLPLINGEKLVLRLLSKTAMMVDIENLGFSERNLNLFRSLLHLPNGIILVTGPTGSGKTTTLYSALNEIKGIERNIVTVENPVEYKLPLISQVQVNSERGVTFSSALRAILRQDPNVILVGEIRDSETGIIATEAALTGHLVLSTLHTNDAIGAVPRLVNIGVSSFWVSASVIGIIAQRLLRRICARCQEEYLPSKELLESFGLANLPEGTTLYRGRGCAFCNGTGYKGRLAIHEILIITEELRDIIYGEVTTTKLKNVAIANNFKDMYFDGMTKALAGITTIEEVQRVTRRVV
ncbi:MAG: type II/IV secretion system protein [Bacteroidetes bacterium]|nr:MAG: type II/IV secretion system protein [Bacteroidota bacterium]